MDEHPVVKLHDKSVAAEVQIIASVVDHISPQFVSTIPIPRLNGDLEEKIASKIKEAEELRAKASTIINQEIDALENTLLSKKE